MNTPIRIYNTMFRALAVVSAAALSALADNGGDDVARSGRRAPAIALRQLVIAAVALCCAAGCQSQSGQSSTPGAPPAPGSQASNAAHRANPIDACSMLSPQDISALLGVTVQGKSTNKDPEMADCTWENPSTQESVSVQLSNPGTARNNILPPPEPGFADPTTHRDLMACVSWAVARSSSPPATGTTPSRSRC
jgi:hypothetical protein